MTVSRLPVNATEAADEDEMAEIVEEVCWMPAGGTDEKQN